MLKIRYGMTSRECFENNWFYMKYIGKYLSEEILLARECTTGARDTDHLPFSNFLFTNLFSIKKNSFFIISSLSLF
jgi:hypothetical protein